MRPRVRNGSTARIFRNIGDHAAIENGFPVSPTIVDPIQTDDRIVQIEAHLVRDACHLRQCFLQHWGLIPIPRRGNKRGNHIAVAIAEGHHFIAFEVFMPAESEVIATFVCYCRCPISMNDADVEVLFLVKLPHRALENGLKASLGFEASKGAIDSRVVALRSSILGLRDRQILPLTPEVQQFQDVIENHMQLELRLRTTSPHFQMGQDKFLKLFLSSIVLEFLALEEIEPSLPLTTVKLKRLESF